MVKAIKKTHRRLKKRIRKTLGTLFLVSALVVSAIPVDNLQAAGEETLSTSLTPDTYNIPVIGPNETIYTTGDGQYQFAYVLPTSGGTNKVAVILGYNSGFLVGNNLVIPDVVDAYRKYSDNLGTDSGYAAVGQDGSFLFFKTMEVVKDEYNNIVYEPDLTKPKLDEEGKQIIENGQPVYEMKEKMQEVFYPCYYENINAWKDLEVRDYYYISDPSVSGNGRYTQVGDNASKQRIQNATVQYIGNQYLVEGTEQGTWQLGGTITNPEDGVFANNGNIINLTVGQRLSGIGNAAFYGCTMLQGISLENGLNTIGNYAFANCINLKSTSLPMASNLKTIGDHAFYNCQGLASFKVPVNVSEIKESAFEGCVSMTQIELRGDGDNNVLLTTIGKNVFKNCSSLEYLALPTSYSTPMDISNLQGCSSLRYISAPDSRMNFTDGEDAFTLAKFKEMVSDEFYFEGIGDQALHQTAKQYSIAFKYWNQDVYEIIITDSANKKATYRVNSSDELIEFSVDKGMEVVEIPDAVGPYHIRTLKDSSFLNNCFLKKVVIPSSVQIIGANAFMGCHELTAVIFKEPVSVSSIGANAFQTQANTLHYNDCPTSGTLKQEPVLSFTGPVDKGCVPFDYAMSDSSKINVGTQTLSYITYYSGWPQNLTVKYNPVTDKNELTDYPTFAKLSSYTVADYPYMTTEYAQSALNAAGKFLGTVTGEMTEYETQIVDSALNIVLPEGIEAISDGLFATKEDTETSDSRIRKSLTSYGLLDIAPNSFKGFDGLQSVYLYGNVKSVGDYAFRDCINLKDVVISKTADTLGLVPFLGCNMLQNVDFQGGPYFTCANSIIYGLEDGAKKKVIEYLNGRETGVVEASEMEGVTEVAVGAFKDTNVSSVDFRKSGIKDIPEDAFRNTKSLFSVYLPYGCLSISDNSFTDSALKYLEVPGTVSYIGNEAFENITPSTLTFYCEDGTNAKIYADKKGFKTSQKPIEQKFTVRFWDDESNLLDEYTQQVDAGTDAVPPELTKEGYTFDKWVPDYRGITRDTDCVAQFKPIDPDSLKHTVKFYDFNNNEIDSQLVADGEDADPPTVPEVEGYIFKGWRPEVTNITKDTDIYAWYEPKKADEFTVNFYDDNQTLLYTQTVTSGKTVIMPKDPVKAGYTFQGWLPSIDGVPVTADVNVYARYDRTDGNGGGGGGTTPTTPTGSTGSSGSSGTSGSSSSGGGNNGTNAKFYTLTVKNGSGSGSYVAGTQPIVIANDPAEGLEFDNWTVDPANVTIASKTLSATVVTMPEANVTLTANYKTKGSAGSSTGSGNSSTNTSGNKNSGGGSGGTVTKPGGSGSGGTTVVIDKNGLSNTGVVSAVVNGSSDDFTIKITESTEASEAVVRALMDKYGDLTNIKYFPMDISLYDSTGSKKITDTTGLSIRITLPLPDSLKEYAGNNKTAAVSNNKLEDLTEKFTTISGVPCVTFTAEHFSPYVIYVDTANLTAGTNSDMTPKTGDGIHPKWFLAIGLACISLVLFMKQDKKIPVKKAAVVRAK